MLDASDEEQIGRAQQAAEDLFAMAIRLGGTVSGEHGLGILKNGQLSHQWDPAAVELMMKESFERSYRPDGSGRQGLAIAASPDRTWDLGRVRVPALVIHGLADPLVQPSGGIATARAIPGAKLVMYPDMGHDLPEPRWDDVVAEIAAIAR